MRKRLLWPLLLLPMLSFCAEPAFASTASDAIPPKRFWGRAHANVHFRTTEKIQTTCANAGSPVALNMEIVACSLPSTFAHGDVDLPLPCSYAKRGEYYARIVCHEIAHLRGWSNEHEK